MANQATASVKPEDVLLPGDNPGAAARVIVDSAIKTDLPSTDLKKLLAKVNELVAAVGGGIQPLA